MKRLIISMSVLFLLAFFSLVPTFAGIYQMSEVLTLQKELVNPDHGGDTYTPKTNYVAELNKIGIAGRPESDNAAPYYLKAIELYVKVPGGLKVSTRSWPKELPAQQHALLRKWVQDNSRALEQLQLASQKPYCWFKHTGQTLQKVEMPQLYTIRQLALALQARAKLQAEDGNITNALNDIATLYTIGAQMSVGPKTLVEKLVGIAVKTLPIWTAFNILDKKMVDANLMKSLEDRFKQLVTDYNEPFDIRSEKLSLQEQVETDPKYRFFKPYLNSTLEYYDTIAAKNTWQLHNEKTQSITEDNPLIETAGSGIPSVIEIEYRTRVDEQALITTLAILRYNADSDAYPGALPQLVSAGYLKELPIDPFSNKPLVYKQTRQGFTLYSFGADFDDDGGLHSKWGSGEEGGDQVFWPIESTGGAEVRVAVQKRLTGQELIEANNSLFQAVIKGDVSQVNLLISKGADLNSKNRLGWTPLHTALQHRRQTVAEVLIVNGADINAKDRSGLTPLQNAVDLGQKEAVEMLIAKGADVNVMGGRGDNALSLAKKKRNTEIVDLLVEHGAKEPSPQDMMGDRYYEDYGYDEGQSVQRRGYVAQQPVQEVDILADPNEIKIRVKTFEGLEKALEEIAGKSQSEMRLWEQKRYDNRTLLIKGVQKQFEEEIGFIQKAAVEEKATKTTEAIDSMLSRRQELFKKVGKELMAQKREMKLMQQPTRGRSRARTSSRSTRSRYPQRGQAYGGNMMGQPGQPYDDMSGMNSYEGARGPSAEQIDREAEDEIRQWLQVTAEGKADLAKAVHEQIRLDISYIRKAAVEEEAKKTTATIDGLLLARQMRFEAYVSKIEEEKRALQQAQDDPRSRYGVSRRSQTTTGRYPQQGQPTGQQNTQRNRRRR